MEDTELKELGEELTKVVESKPEDYRKAVLGLKKGVV